MQENRRRSGWAVIPFLVSFLAAVAGFDGHAWSQQVFVDESATRLPIVTGVSLKPVLVDVDGDGDLDVFLAGVGTNRLLINDGSGVFTDETNRLFLQFPGLSRAAVACDVDGKNGPDLFVVGSGTGVLAQDHLWINDGSGHFNDRTSTFLPTDTAIGVGAACVDVNGDGHPDIFVANLGQSRLLINDGSGKFTDETASRLPSLSDTSTGVTVLNTTVDAKPGPHFFITNAGQSRLLRNDGTGKFDDVTTDHLPDLSHDISNGAVALTADVDGKPGPHLFIANVGQSKLLRNDGTGHFTDVTAAHLPVLNDVSTGVTVLDANKDGKPDLFIANGGQNRLLLNDGTGHFIDATASELPLRTDNSSGVAAADLDGDGDADVFVTNLGESNRILINNGTFTDETDTRLPVVNDLSLGVVMSDVNGDGYLDIYIPTSQQNRLFMNNGKGVFKDETVARLPVFIDFSNDAALGDVNGDGSPDIVVGNSGPTFGTGAQNRLLINDGTGVFTDQTAKHMPAILDPTQRIILADFDKDGDLDILAINFYARHRLLRNAGASCWTAGPPPCLTDVTSTSGLPSTKQFSVGGAVGDLDGDGYPDIVVANLGQSQVFINKGATAPGVFIDQTAARLPVLNTSSAAIVLGDVNGDGKLDIFLVNSGEQSLLLINNGTGVFVDETAARLPAFADDSSGAVLLDVNKDGALDIFIANRSGGNRLLLNDGTGHFTDATATLLPGGEDNAEGVAAGDLNHDGYIDVFVANFFGQNRLLMNRVPEIAQAVPPSGIPGETLDVVLTGVNTHFVQGTSHVSFSGGCITVGSTTVTNPTTILASITIGNCPTGLQDITVTTGSEVAMGVGLFDVVPQSSISGTVTKQSDGSPVVGAKVRLTMAGSAVPQTTTTDADGHYAFPNLDPGDYQVSASKRVRIKNYKDSETLTLSLGEERIVDLVLGF